jgi:hypothetical protein
VVDAEASQVAEAVASQVAEHRVRGEVRQ